MTNIAKLLIGTAVVAGVGAVVAIVAENEEKKDRIVIKDNHGNEKVVVTKASTVEVDSNGEVVEDKSVIKRIKKFVTKKFIKALAWVALHMQQIEALGVIIGLGSAVFSIAGAIRDFKNGNDTQEKLDRMEHKLDVFYKVYDHNRLIDDANAQKTLDYIHKCHKTEVHNQHVLGYELDTIADKVGVDMDQLDKELTEKFDNKKTA